MKEETDIGKLIYDETESRLAEMAKANYEFPPKAGAWNWWVITASIAVCAVLIILCQTGVIK